VLESLGKVDSDDDQESSGWPLYLSIREAQGADGAPTHFQLRLVWVDGDFGSHVDKESLRARLMGTYPGLALRTSSKMRRLLLTARADRASVVGLALKHIAALDRLAQPRFASHRDGSQ
jgi:hypothetical protein